MLKSRYTYFTFTFICYVMHYIHYILFLYYTGFYDNNYVSFCFCTLIDMIYSHMTCLMIHLCRFVSYICISSYVIKSKLSVNKIDILKSRDAYMYHDSFHDLLVHDYAPHVYITELNCHVYFPYVFHAYYKPNTNEFLLPL